MKDREGIIGNPDVAPLYDPLLHPDVAAAKQRAETQRTVRSTGSAIYIAERMRRGRLTLHGVVGDPRLDRIIVGAPTIEDAIKAAREIANEYFEASSMPWIVHGRKFYGGKEP